MTSHILEGKEGDLTFPLHLYYLFLNLLNDTYPHQMRLDLLYSAH